MKILYSIVATQQLIDLVGGFTFETRTSLYPSQKFRVRSYHRIGCKPEEYDDGIGDINPRTNSDGEKLASEFYKSLKKQNYIDDVGLSVGDRSSSNEAITEDSPAEARRRNREELKIPPSISSSNLGRNDINDLFETNSYYDSEQDKSQTPNLKFTGRAVDSNEYFGRSSGDTGNNVREKMMRKEYELVSGASSERTIAFQAAIALSMLIFFIYVGLTGGIVSGEGAIQMDFGDDIINFEDVIPIPRDSSNSIWI